MAFGASTDTLPFASDYLGIYLIGIIFVQLSIGLNPFISSQGKAKTAMTSMLIGAILIYIRVLFFTTSQEPHYDKTKF